MGGGGGGGTVFVNRSVSICGENTNMMTLTLSYTDHAALNCVIYST